MSVSSESCAALCSESCAALCLAVGSKDDCAAIVKVQRHCAYIVWSDVNRVNESLTKVGIELLGQLKNPNKKELNRRK